jgi:hypothetical protein
MPSPSLRVLFATAVLTLGSVASADEPAATIPAAEMSAHLAYNDFAAGMRAYAGGFGMDFFFPNASGLIPFGMQQSLYAHAVELAKPPLDVMRDAGCLAPTDAFDRAVEARANASADAARTFTATYALSADFSALVTTVVVHDEGIASEGKRDRPVLRELVIVSDRLQPGTKTDADKAALVALENAHAEAIGLPALAKKANAGDVDARQQGYPLSVRHKKRLRDARADDWSVYDAAYRRAQLWSENSCARLHQAIEANAAETMRLLDLLATGSLGAQLPEDWLAPGFTRRLVNNTPVHNLETDPAKAGERRVYRDGEAVFVSRRAGDDVVVDFRHRVYQASDEAKAHAGNLGK